jgi:hypothetical protein
MLCVSNNDIIHIDIAASHSSIQQRHYSDRQYNNTFILVTTCNAAGIATYIQT